jgi:hypothetical protein
MRLEGIEKSNRLMRIRTLNLPVFTVVTQPTTLLCAIYVVYNVHYHSSFHSNMPIFVSKLKSSISFRSIIQTYRCIRTRPDALKLCLCLDPLLPHSTVKR